MSTDEKLVDKLEALFADVPAKEIPSIMGNKASLLESLGKASNSDLHELHTLSDIRAAELEQERIGHQNKRWLYSLLGNVSGGAAGALIGFIQEPFESVRGVVSEIIIRGANEADPRYVGHLRGEFVDNLNYTIDQASRVPTAVAVGILGWIVVGYLARRMYNNRREVRDTENQYHHVRALKICSEETIIRRYGR